MAGPEMAGLGVLGREIHGAPGEIHVAESDPDRFANPAAKFIDETEHEFVPVVGDMVEEFLKFLHSQIPYCLPETLVCSTMFHI